MNSKLKNPNYNRSQCCWNCQEPGHLAKDCKQEKNLFCSHCLKPNIASKHCSCGLQTKGRTLSPRRTNPNFPTCPRAPFALQSPFNVTVGEETFRAFINTMENITRVGYLVSTKASIVYGVRRDFFYFENQITSDEVIPLMFNNRLRNIRCKIMETPDNIVIFGTDALQCFGCELRLNGQQLLNLPGCLIDHTPTFPERNIAGPSRIKSNQSRKAIQSRPPRGHKNPINLNVDELFPNPEINEETALTNKTPEEKNLPAPNPEYSKWSLLVLQEARNECDYAAMEYIMNLDDKELGRCSRFRASC